MSTFPPTRLGQSPGQIGADTRSRWVDCCKGICIILVVYGHVTGGLEASGAVRAGSVYDWMRDWVYLFHMPAFFFLSGLFAYKALKHPLEIVLLGKMANLVYPYVLWTGIYLMVQEVMARYANNPPDAGRASHFLWEPYGYGLWFLYSLLIISIVFHLLMMTQMKKEALLILAFALRIAAEFNLFGFWPILNTAMLNFVFYAISGLYAKSIFELLSRAKRTQLLMTGIILLGLMTATGLVLGNSLVALGLILAFLGVAGVVCIAQGLANTIVEKFFSVLGFCSLEIYLGHALFGTASRAVLVRCGIHEALPSILSGVFVGVAASLVLAILCQKLGFPFLYRWPAKKTLDRSETITSTISAIS